MDLTEGARRLLAYWGEIQNAVTRRAGTAEIWADVHNAATREGVALTGISASDMSTLRGIAAGMRNSMESFSRLGQSEVITPAVMASDVSARSLGDQSLAPRWIVRFEHDVIVNGQLQTLWRSSVFDASLPATAGELRTAIEGDAVALANDYDITHAGVGRLQISAV